jgi:hypothetical protein
MRLPVIRPIVVWKWALARPHFGPGRSFGGQAFGRDPRHQRLDGGPRLDEVAQCGARGLEEERRGPAEGGVRHRTDDRATARTGFDPDEVVDFENPQCLAEGRPTDFVALQHQALGREHRPDRHLGVDNVGQDLAREPLGNLVGSADCRHLVTNGH